MSRPLKIFLIIAALAAMTASLVLVTESGNPSAPDSELQKNIITDAGGTVARICTKRKNTPQQSRAIKQGVLILETKAGYPITDIRHFLTINQYRITGESYFKISKRYQIGLEVPIGEEYCWADELDKRDGVERVSMLSTLQSGI